MSSESFRHLRDYTIMATIINLLLLLLVCSAVHAEPVDTRIIVQMESSGNVFARNGRHYGLMQLSEGVLHDYNKTHNTIWKPVDLFNGVINIRIGDWYINHEIVRLLAHYRLKDTLENRLTAWRYGIGAVINGKRADKYIKRYKQSKKGV